MAGRSFRVDGLTLLADPAPAGLHIVATPIGNLGDITLRALRTLAGADVVAAEDTRHTGKLLAHYAITARLMRYDEHGAKAQRPKLLAQLGEGAAVALVSDAGTPLISDPGFRLVAEARAAGVAVHAVPGPSAVLAALSVAGVPTDTVVFAGFLPAKAGARASRIAELKALRATLVLFEAPHRLGATLSALSEGLGERDAAVARELTKRFETVDAAPLSELAQRYAESETRGEIVVLVAPREGEEAIGEAEVTERLRQALTRLPASAAAAEVAKATGASRQALYRQAIALKERG